MIARAHACESCAHAAIPGDTADILRLGSLWSSVLASGGRAKLIAWRDHARLSALCALCREPIGSRTFDLELEGA